MDRKLLKKAKKNGWERWTHLLLYCLYLTGVSKVALEAAERQNCTGALPKAGLH